MGSKKKIKSKQKQRPDLLSRIEEKPKRKFHGVLLGSILGILLAGAGGFFAYGQSATGTIANGVFVLGHDLSGLSLNDARGVLDGLVSSYTQSGVTVQVDGQTLHPTVADLGVTIDSAKTLDAAYSVGRTTIFGESLRVPRMSQQTNVGLEVQLSKKTFDAYFTKIAKQYSSPVHEPTLVVNDGAIVSIPGTAGRTVSVPTSTTDLRAAVEQLSSYTIPLATTLAEPTLTEQDLSDTRATMESMLSAPLTLHYQKNTFVVPVSDLDQWITVQYDDPTAGVSNQPHVVLAKNVVDVYLTSLNDTIGVSAKPTYGYHAEINGEYSYKKYEGLAVNIADTETAIDAALRTADKRTVDIVMSTTEPQIDYLTVTAPHPTGKVIEVDLSRQVLFAFEDGTLKFWTHVSTGIKGRDTPPGEWKIYNKTPIQSMIGQGYNLPNVKWVMPYNGDYTLHTAYWHTDFGKVKSHGCTNMSEKDAKWLYDWATVGTPVVISAAT